MQNMLDLPDDSLVRLSSILAPRGPVPGSRSSWYVWRKAGIAPPAIRIGPNTVAYRVGDVRAFVQQTGVQQTSTSLPHVNTAR